MRCRQEDCGQKHRVPAYEVQGPKVLGTASNYSNFFKVVEPTWTLHANSCSSQK